MTAEIWLEDEDETRACAARLAAVLRPGDVVLLEGPVGAGKSAFARAAIQAAQRAAGQVPEDVPSPSFTLVQIYEAGPLSIWHADLYRLADPDEVEELGLAEAYADAAVFVEWPERLGADRPARALTLRLDPDPDLPGRRRLAAHAEGGGWDAACAAIRLTGAQTGAGP